MSHLFHCSLLASLDLCRFYTHDSMSTRAATKHMWLNSGDKLSMVVDTYFEPDEAPNFWGLQSGRNVFLSIRTPEAQEQFRTESGVDGFVDLGNNFFLSTLIDKPLDDHSELAVQSRCHTFRVGDKYTADNGDTLPLEIEPAMKAMCGFANEMGVDLSDAPPPLADTAAMTRVDLTMAVTVLCGWYAHDHLPPPKASLLQVMSRVQTVGRQHVEHDLVHACVALGNGREEWEFCQFNKEVQEIVKLMFGGLPPSWEPAVVTATDGAGTSA